MKLRNKITGEIKEGVEISVWLDKEGTLKFISLTDLNEQWEDYEPTEPLLKGYPNEMNAIRAYGCSPLSFHRHARKGYSTFNFCSHYICFNGLFENLKTAKATLSPNSVGKKNK